MPFRPEDLLFRTEVEDAVIRMSVATDERDWPTVESCFTEPFNRYVINGRKRSCNDNASPSGYLGEIQACYETD
jgi:hypothetical protein